MGAAGDSESHKEMTEAQQMAVATAYLMLENTFDHVLIVVKDKEIQGATVQPDSEVCWTGGYIAAKALAEDATSRIAHRKPMTRCPPNVSKTVMETLDLKAKTKSRE